MRNACTGCLIEKFVVFPGSHQQDEMMFIFQSTSWYSMCKHESMLSVNVLCSGKQKEISRKSCYFVSRKPLPVLNHAKSCVTVLIMACTTLECIAVEACNGIS